jgi:RNA polymerase sigma-54 factor
MKPGLSQSVRLGQELKINPRLYQAMDMLYMPLLDLQQHLKQELLVNPFLELADEEDDVEPDVEAPGEGEADDDAPSDAAAATPETDHGDGEGGEGGDDDGGDSDGGDAAVEADLADTIASSDESPAADEDGETWDAILEDGFDAEGDRREEREDRERFEPVPVAAGGLSEHLRDQIRLLDLSPRDLVLAEEFIGSIGDDGYLTATLEEIREGVNEAVRAAAERAGVEGDVPLYTAEEVQAMLAVIQGLDPAGVGARDLRECLLLQLRDAGREDSLPARLVRDHFDDLIAHRWGEIARAVGVTPAEAQAAADEVARLNPKPGLAKSSAVDNYVVPDLIVEKVDGEYLVFLNDTSVPRLRLSRAYRDLVRNRKSLNAEHREFIANKLNAAQWLIQAIEQRRQTMLKVMHFIVNRQRDFFDKGIQYLKPLTLREVADAIGMHESTVSRVTNEKYAQTPRGVLPLKFFFSSGLSTVDGEDVSARGIRATIEKLVKEEDPRNPLTDQAIAAILERQGVRIARRTVAKYREQLGVLSARMRKRV